MDSKETFKLEYATVNNYILHYSNVRSALTSFLITVALAAFAAYFNTSGAERVAEDKFFFVERGPHLLWIASYLLLAAAVVASLWFTYRTEHVAEGGVPGSV